MDENEVWKPVKGYEGLYEVSNLGRVRSLNYNQTREVRVLTPRKHNRGYLQISLCKDGKSKTTYIHRIVAETFLDKVEGREFVDHINGCVIDNRAENLRWCTPKENSNNKITKERMINVQNKPETKEKISRTKSKPVLQYTKSGEFVTEYYGVNEAQRKTGISISLISKCCNGKGNSAGGYIWKYKS